MKDVNHISDDGDSFRSFNIVGLSYVSLYLKDFDEAAEFYSQVFGPSTSVENHILCWPMGSTMLTIFPSEYGSARGSNPRNTEFGIQVASPEEVDFLSVGAKGRHQPEDTWMYETMRFACIDDPFGVRIDIYCPIPEEKAGWTII